MQQQLFNLQAVSAGSPSWRGYFRCRQTESGCWSSCPRSRNLCLLLGLPAHSAARKRFQSKNAITSLVAAIIYTNHLKASVLIVRRVVQKHVTVGRSSRYLWPCVHDVNESAVVIGLTDGLQHVLVFEAAGAEPRERLTAPTHCCLSDKRQKNQMDLKRDILQSNLNTRAQEAQPAAFQPSTNRIRSLCLLQVLYLMTYF